MEYVFGTQGSKETLRTKGGEHSSLTGWQHIEQEYPNQTISDSFYVVRKMASREDSEGNMYDWYEIQSHYRVIDNTAPAEKLGKLNSANIDYLSMMAGIDLPDEDDGGKEV